MKTMLSILMMMIIAAMPTGVFGSPDDILQKLWENDTTSCGSGNCTEIAVGAYHRNGVDKPFTLLRKSQNGNSGADKTTVRLEFTNPRANKYIIISTFHQQLGMVETRQAALLPDIDPDRPRIVAPAMYEELRETNINPLFLTLSLHLMKKYTSEISHGEEMEAILKKDPNPDVNEMLRGILPHKIYVRVEERGGHTAPVEVQMYRNEMVICTIHMKNAIANGRLRPFEIRLTSYGKTDKIIINSWGLVQHDDTYFTPTGLGRGELSIPQVFFRTMCPPEMCKN